VTHELTADRVVHGVGICLGVIGVIVLVCMTAIDGHPGNLAPVLIYAAGLLAMLGCSAAYNVLHTSRRREWLRRSIMPRSSP